MQVPTGRDVGTRVGGRVTYAPDTDRGRRVALREHEAATAVGLATGWRNDLPVPFPHAGAWCWPTKHSSTRWSCCTVSSRICAPPVAGGHRCPRPARLGVLVPGLVRQPALMWRNSETLRRLRLLVEGRAGRTA